MTIKIITGIGNWKAEKTVKLITAPHKGDRIVVGEHVIDCDIVEIHENYVQVYEKRMFQSEQDAKEFFTGE